MSLNAKQKNAVSCDDNCLVVACPGSGKSKVVVSKVVSILEQNPEANIVVVTFSREGANELRERLSPLLSANELKHVYASTFHSLALAHLKREKISVRIAKDVNEYLIRALDHTGCDLSLEEAQKLLQNCKTTLNYQPSNDYASMIYKEYQAICKKNNVIDFYDIMNMSLEKISNGSMPVLNLTHMLVDEFQDSDEIQYQYMMAHAKVGVKVTAVGDDDQAIYAFRNSLGYEGMRRFETEAKAVRVILDTNYRCKKEILSAAGKLIEYNGSRMDKKLLANRGVGGTIAVSRYPNRKDEAAAVSEKIISTLVDGEVASKQWAVLARNNILLEAIDAELKNYNIPTIKSFKPIWERSPVSLMLSLMKSFDSKEKTNIDHLLYWCGIGNEDLVLLNKLLNNDYSKLFDKSFTDNINTETLSTVASKKLKVFIRDLNGWAKGNSRSDPERTDSVITSIASFMISSTRKNVDKQRLGIALTVLLKVKGSMLERVSFVTKKNEAKDGVGVHLMTMHGSKGLEFDNVWIIAAEEGVIPSGANLVITETIIEEERRLMYVAMTRARDNLYVSSTADNPASVFLKESNLA